MKLTSILKPSCSIYRNYFTWLLLLMAGHFVGYSQPKQIVFKHYGAAKGFNSDEATDIVKSKNGLLWISSGDGLAKFDGKKFTFFQHSNTDTNSITSNYCKGLRVDKRGWIWLTVNDDLDIFDPATETFRHIKLDSEDGKRLQVKPYTYYYDSLQDIMWVSTKSGLYFSKAGSAKLESASKITPNSIVIDAPICSIVPDGKDWLWLAGENKIVKLHTKTGATENYVVPHIVSGFNNNGQIYLLSGYLDKNKTLWLGSFTMGLFSFNTISKKFEQYVFGDIKKEENSIPDIIQTGWQGQDDVLFCSTVGKGITAFNTTTKKFTSYSAASNNSALGIAGSTYGLNCFGNQVWIGSASGLHCYDNNLQLFEKKDLTEIADNVALLSVSIMNVERNADGKDERIWLHVPYKNTYVYDLLREKILPVPANIAKYISSDAGIISMYIDRKNILWLGTNKYGLIGYDILKDVVIINSENKFDKYGEWVHEFYEAENADLWLCSYKGLYKIKAGTTNALPVAAVNELIKSDNISDNIVAVTQDEFGKIWITADYSDKKNAGIIKYDPVTDKAHLVYNEALETNGINPPVDIRSICSNGKGKIFVVFFRENIFWFNSNSIDKILINDKARLDGVNNTAIDYMLCDKDGNIWINNSLGIAQYKINQNSFSNYNFTDYELKTTSAPAIYISPNSGKLYVGQSNSFLLFDIGGKKNDINDANLLFDDLKIFNKLYPQKIMDGDKVVLDHQQNMLSIEFALLSYSNSHENTYSWRLEGLEKEWNISKNNIANYSHLQPGKYTLLVKAANSNGVWKSEPIKLYIVIKPAFYNAWWFRSLLLLIVLGIAWKMIQLRIKRIKEKFELRNSIAADLHDEIGSTLTSISILSNVSHQAIEEHPKQAKELMEQISSQSRIIQQNMSDIVWSIRTDNEKIENLLVRIREYAAQTLEPLNIETSIEADELLLSQLLPMQYKKDVLLICKEAINNIAKHSNATAASILLNCDKKSILINITDNGKWKGNNSGTGTKTMKERAKALAGSLLINTDETGTTILVALPLP